MATPKACGRMIRKSISESEKIASLSPIAAVLFVMLIPHFNVHGKMPGGAGIVKDECVPLIPYLTYENIPGYLQEISDKTNVKWFRVGSKWWLHSLSFNTEHQDLRADKMGIDSLPGYCDDGSGNSSGVVPNSPSRAEGFRVEGFKEELKPQQQQHAREQLAVVVEERREDITRLFPDIDVPVAVEKLLHHFRDSPLLIDPWMMALKWLQREFRADVVAVSGAGADRKPRASPITRETDRARIMEKNAEACRRFAERDT